MISLNTFSRENIKLVDILFTGTYNSVLSIYPELHGCVCWVQASSGPLPHWEDSPAAVHFTRWNPPSSSRVANWRKFRPHIVNFQTNQWNIPWKIEILLTVLFFFKYNDSYECLFLSSPLVRRTYKLHHIFVDIAIVITETSFEGPKKSYFYACVRSFMTF